MELIVHNSVDLMANTGHLLLFFLLKISLYHIILFIRCICFFVFFTSECPLVKHVIFFFVLLLILSFKHSRNGVKL